MEEAKAIPEVKSEKMSDFEMVGEEAEDDQSINLNTSYGGEMEEVNSAQLE